MAIDFRSLANSYISNLTPYQLGKPVEEVERELGIRSAIKLASNENLLGPSPRAIAAAQTALFKSHYYPDGGCFILKNELSAHLNVQSNQITVGNGSENILEIIVKAYLGINDTAIISQYAFLTISLLIKSYGANLITVPAKNYGHDIDQMIAAITDKTKIVFIVNPNNPTGTYTSKAQLNKLLTAIPSSVLVVLDEAYYEYIEKDDYPQTLSLLSQFPNLIITRTFSKIYGLAALRLGYAVSSPEIADILNRARLPFNVNSIAAAAAVAAIHDTEHLQRTLAMNNDGMLQVEQGLKKLQIEYIPSIGNFITINVMQNSLDIYQKLLLEGIIVRPLNAYGMPTHLRVTIGTAQQNEKFLNALHTVMGK